MAASRTCPADLVPRTATNARGPLPCRSAKWPWGFPWNTGQARAVAEEDDDDVRFVLKVTHETLVKNSATAATVCALEQFGAASCGTPASIWSLPEVRAWARRLHLWRVAFYQCERGPSMRSMPTAMLVNHKVSLKHAKEAGQLGCADVKCSITQAHLHVNARAKTRRNTLSWSGRPRRHRP